MASRSAHGGVRHDPRAANVEASEFPILCETCLGPNPYVRMLQDKWGRPCKVCERPFTVFRWKPAGDGMRYKNTEICQTCARMKNVCQTCVLDLAYGLPVQVRDAGMEAANRQMVTKPTSDIARQYAASQGSRAIANGKVDAAYSAPMANSVAERAKRSGPHHGRNRAQLCSWFAKGQCSRGLYCQFRHELPQDKSHPFSQQNIQDRFYGVNDPVAASILARSASSQKGKRKGPQGDAPEPPEDESIVSLFIGGVTTTVTEAVLRAMFDSAAEDIGSVKIMREKSIAFIDFTSREAAEKAISLRHGRVELADAKLTISWARGFGGPRGQKRANPGALPRGLSGPSIPDVSGIVPFVQPPPSLARKGSGRSQPEQASAHASDAANRGERQSKRARQEETT